MSESGEGTSIGVIPNETARVAEHWGKIDPERKAKIDAAEIKARYESGVYQTDFLHELSPKPLAEVLGKYAEGFENMKMDARDGVIGDLVSHVGFDGVKIGTFELDGQKYFGVKKDSDETAAGFLVLRKDQQRNHFTVESYVRWNTNTNMALDLVGQIEKFNGWPMGILLTKKDSRPRGVSVDAFDPLGGSCPDVFVRRNPKAMEMGFDLTFAHELGHNLAAGWWPEEKNDGGVVKEFIKDFLHSYVVVAKMFVNPQRKIEGYERSVHMGMSERNADAFMVALVRKCDELSIPIVHKEAFNAFLKYREESRQKAAIYTGYSQYSKHY